MESSLQISPVEYEERAVRLLEHLRSRRLAGVVLFGQAYILYYTGFAFIPTERPMAYVVNAHGDRILFVPRLEAEHAHQRARVDRVDFYVEYPTETHPMQIFKGLLQELKVEGIYGADHDGYPWIFGYRGPSLTELIGSPPQPVAAFIEDEMMIKSPAEIGLIRESARWANLSHTLLQRYTRPGATETEVSQRASVEATQAMLDEIGADYRAQNIYYSGPSAAYRGQIGRNAAIPHALANNIVFQLGDVLVTGAGCPMWGYESELERTLIVGKASDEQKRMFDHMLALQDLALNTIRPGVRCCDVDRATRAYYEDNHLTPFWKHHTGHAIGLRYHEAPFLDTGDQTEIRPGMVFAVEPGLYVPDLGGFRHSDTIVVREDGIEMITSYPRDLESLTIQA